jgi:hypothetical protein
VTASAYDSDTSPAGWPAAAGEAAAAEWLRLADKAVREAEDPVPETVEIALLRLAKIADRHEYRLISRGTIVATPTLPNETPRHPRKAGASGGALIDDFLARGEAWTSVRDEHIWTALLAWANTSKPTANAIRSASDAVAVGIALRHGVPLTALQLSHGAVRPLAEKEHAIP